MVVLFDVLQDPGRGWGLQSCQRQVGMRVGHAGPSGLEVPSGNGDCHRPQGPEESLRRQWGWGRREGLELSPEQPFRV